LRRADLCSPLRCGVARGSCGLDESRRRPRPCTPRRVTTRRPPGSTTRRPRTRTTRLTTGPRTTTGAALATSGTTSTRVSPPALSQSDLGSEICYGRAPFRSQCDGFVPPTSDVNLRIVLSSCQASRVDASQPPPPISRTGSSCAIPAVSFNLRERAGFPLPRTCDAWTLWSTDFPTRPPMPCVCCFMKSDRLGS